MPRWAAAFATTARRREPTSSAAARIFFNWQDMRRTHGLWPYARSTSSAPQARCSARTDTGEDFAGINFASQDYLSLSTTQPSRMGQGCDRPLWRPQRRLGGTAGHNTVNSRRLSNSHSPMSSAGGRSCSIPRAWAAGYGSIQGFVRPNDHVVMDILAHSCLQEGARAATSNIHYHGLLNLEAITRKHGAYSQYRYRKTASCWSPRACSRCTPIRPTSAP